MQNNNNNPIYLDNQATTPVDRRVLAVMLPFFEKQYGNPHSSDHFFGWQSKKAVEDSRKKIATFLNCDSDEIVFTSGATEANNLAILGSLEHLKSKRKSKIVVSAFEHKCVLEAAKAAERQGFEIEYIAPNSEGIIEPANLEAIMDESVGLVSVMTVNNEIGTVQPIEKLSEIAHFSDALFHTDAAQAGVFYDLDVTKGFIDFVSISAHKLYGPKGIGALWIRREVKEHLAPIIHGGGQEGGIRSGTLPTMLCVGMGEACELAKLNRLENNEYLQSLSTAFWELLHDTCPRTRLNGCEQHRHPGNLNIQFYGTDAHSLIAALQPYVAASTGSACTSGTQEPSYVLRAIGLSEDEAQSSLRFSFGLTNTHDEIPIAVRYIDEALFSLHDEVRDQWLPGAMKLTTK